jgi:hypothetical protein
MHDSQTKRQRYIGCYASEEDAARAYDCAAVQAGGPSAKRNFPDEDISVPPVSLGEERKQHTSSDFIGVSWYKANSSWMVQMRDSQTKRYIGSFASEEDAARAYDRAAVEARGPDTKRNFPAEDISEPPVSSGGGRSKVSAKRRRQEESESEEEEEQSEEERNEEQRQQCLAWMEECKEIEQIVVAELVAILGRQEAEKALMAQEKRAGWGGFT